MMRLLCCEQSADGLRVRSEGLVEVALEYVGSMGIDDFQGGGIIDGDAVGGESDDCYLTLLNTGSHLT